jgi:hypothetical protein
VGMVLLQRNANINYGTPHNLPYNRQTSTSIQMVEAIRVSVIFCFVRSSGYQFPDVVNFRPASP